MPKISPITGMVLEQFKETVAGRIKSTVPLQRQLSAPVPRVQEPSTLRTYVVRHLKALYLEGPGQPKEAPTRSHLPGGPHNRPIRWLNRVDRLWAVGFARAGKGKDDDDSTKLE